MDQTAGQPDFGLLHPDLDEHRFRREDVDRDDAQYGQDTVDRSFDQADCLRRPLWSPLRPSHHRGDFFTELRFVDGRAGRQRVVCLLRVLDRECELGIRERTVNLRSGNLHRVAVHQPPGSVETLVVDEHRLFLVCELDERPLVEHPDQRERRISCATRHPDV